MTRFEQAQQELINLPEKARFIQEVTQSYFPIVIQYSGSKCRHRVHNPVNIVSGKSFKVIEVSQEKR